MNWPATRPMVSSAGFEIAVSLASRPRMLLLDEPTQGMSHSDTHDTEALIRGCRAITGSRSFWWSTTLNS